MSSGPHVNVPQRTLITAPIDEQQLTRLKGNTHPLARAQFDLGTAPASLPMQRMLLVLKRSPEQEHALRTLLDDQQDKNSPNYHKWVTPDQYGKLFGPTDADMQTITSWLQSHGFEVGATKGRSVLEFSGSASQVQEAFHTTIHKYVVNGEQHWANASDPMIPTALTGAVVGVLSLHNFRAKAFNEKLGVFTRSKETGAVKPVQPLFTFPGRGCGVQQNTCYAVGPFDFAKIYDVNPLWGGSPVIDGTGQTIAIVGESEINPQDVADFRNFFGLPASNLTIIHDGPSPGVVGDETESDLDVEWSGAVAKGATIDLVISSQTNSTFGVALSAQYIVDTNLAPVLSMSFGLCELATGTAGNQFYNQLWQQASAQGITAILSSGDSGAAGCDNQNAPPPSPAVFGLAVTGWGDTPYNVSVGGTDFFDLTDQATFWNPTNTMITQASAKSYIPEATWNDTCTNSVFGDLLNFSPNAETNCNNQQLTGFVATVAGSGGISNCTSNDGQNVGSCSGGYAKPSWQTGTPADGKRDIPDVSLFAAAGSPSGSFYIICEADAVTSGSSCNPNDPNTNFFGIGGTSASAPAFAGIMAMVNQQMALAGNSGRQGNANYVLYHMATTQPNAFHDVTQGTIRMPCATGSPNCNTATAGDQIGVLTGYDAGPGYDLATGLGSVDANNLVSDWVTAAGSFHATQTTLGLSSLNITHGTSDTVTISVTSNSGVPTGSVSLIAATGIAAPNGSGTTGVPLQSFTLDNTGKISVPTSSLPGSPNGQAYAVTAHYPGDGTFAASDSSPLMVKVTAEASNTTLSIFRLDNNGNSIQLNNSAGAAPFGTFLFVKATVAGQSGNGFPTGQVQFVPAPGSASVPTEGLGIFNSAPVAIANPAALNSAGTTSIGPGPFLANFDAGTYNISAQYQGDASFAASGSTQPVTFTIQPGFAAFLSSGVVVINAPGQSGTDTLGVLASTGFTNAVNISCSGLPAEAACSMPAVTPNGPNSFQTGTITVTTKGPHLVMAEPSHRTFYVATMFSGLPLAGIFLLAAPKRRRWTAMFGLMLIALVVMVPACGGGGHATVLQQQDPGTPKGTYTFTLTVTAGSLSEQGSITLVVK